MKQKSLERTKHASKRQAGWGSYGSSQNDSLAVQVTGVSQELKQMYEETVIWE